MNTNVWGMAHNWFKQCFLTYSVSSHYINQCWIIIHKALWNDIQQKYCQNFQANFLEVVICNLNAHIFPNQQTHSPYSCHFYHPSHVTQYSWVSSVIRQWKIKTTIPTPHVITGFGCNCDRVYYCFACYSRLTNNKQLNVLHSLSGLLILTWITFNPSMNISLHPL